MPPAKCHQNTPLILLHLTKYHRQMPPPLATSKTCGGISLKQRGLLTLASGGKKNSGASKRKEKVLTAMSYVSSAASSHDQGAQLPPPSKLSLTNGPAKAAGREAETTPAALNASLSILQQSLAQAQKAGLLIESKQTPHGMLLLLKGTIQCATCQGLRIESCPICGVTESNERAS